MDLNRTFPGYRSLSPAEVAWAENFESATGWKLVGTQSVKDSATFWKMAETNRKKFEDWAALVQTTISLPANKEKLPPKEKGKPDGEVPALPFTPKVDSSHEKTEE